MGKAVAQAAPGGASRKFSGRVLKKGRMATGLEAVQARLGLAAHGARTDGLTGNAAIGFRQGVGERR